jgi:hypothetical protein
MTVTGDHPPNLPLEATQDDHGDECVEPAAAFEILEERDVNAYGFTIKTPVNGLLHRVLPLRDPHQPRFWCVVVFRCSPGGLPDTSEQPWIGPRGLRREDLKETMGAIRADPAAWLAEVAHAQLRDWMLTPGAMAAAVLPSIPDLVVAPRASSK